MANVSMNSVKIGTAGMTEGQIALAAALDFNGVFFILSAGKCTQSEAQARLEEIKAAEVAAAAAAAAAHKSGTLSLKISDKGCVCLSGLNGKWPVSLYANQWERLLGFREQIEGFIVANREELDRLSAAAREAKLAKAKEQPEAPAAQ